MTSAPRIGTAAASTLPPPTHARYAVPGRGMLRTARLPLRPLSAPFRPRSELMPRISAFYGIVIEMYFADHPPPHFHARYTGEVAVIEIATGAVIGGSLPGNALRLVREWLEQHRAELEANVGRLENEEAPKKIEPLQ